MCLFCYKESIQEHFRMQDKSKWYKITGENHIFALQKNIVSGLVEKFRPRGRGGIKKLGQDAV